jgi:hypothetical protein
MLGRMKIARFIVIVAMLIITFAMPGTSVAQKEAAAAPKSQDKLALGQEQAEQLLLLIDTDKSGKISKQE